MGMEKYFLAFLRLAAVAVLQAITQILIFFFRRKLII